MNQPSIRGFKDKQPYDKITKKSCKLIVEKIVFFQAIIFTLYLIQFYRYEHYNISCSYVFETEIITIPQYVKPLLFNHFLEPYLFGMLKLDYY